MNFLLAESYFITPRLQIRYANLLAVFPSENKAANFSKINLLGSGNFLDEVLEERKGNEATSELGNNVEEELFEG